METRWGKRLGRYEIVAELGRGAMGAVYKALDPKIDRFVAIKTISLLGVEGRNEFRERFFVEAQAAGRLLHPGIVTIFDVGEEPESRDPYIVMEYVDGQSLHQLLSAENKKLALDAALQMTEELAEALDCAHSQGVVHRDIKPANILITPEGHPKIADFGIARLDLAHMTLPGQVLGTPAFMSPEQLEGEAVDGRSDLFSLGVIFYKMITGYGPFQGSSVTTVCFKVANRDPVAATTLNAELPLEIDSVIARAIAKDPKQRYQRGIEFAMDLREIRERRALKYKDTACRLPFSAKEKRTPSAENRALGASAKLKSAEEQRGLSVDSIYQLGKNTILPWARKPMVRGGLVLLVAAIALEIPSLNQAWRGRYLEFGARKPAQGSKPEGASKPQPESYNSGASHSLVGLLTAPASVLQPSTSAGSETAKPAAAVQATSTARPQTVQDSNLQLSIEPHFAEASLSLWIDDKLTYSAPLHKQVKKRLVLFRAPSPETMTFRVAHGRHRIRIRVRSAKEKYEQSAAITGNFLKSVQTTVSVNFEKQSGDMSLEVQ